MAPDRQELLADLDDDQRKAVTTDELPLCILAGAGSGKTRVLTRRIAWRVATGQALARHIVALTFTRRASNELSGRLRALGLRDQVVTGTFHAVAYAQLRRRWADAGHRPPTLLERKARIVAPLLPRVAERGQLPPSPADVGAEIEWAKARLLSPKDYVTAAETSGRRCGMPPEAFADVYARYEREKRQRHLIDFDDLLLMGARAIRDDAAFAAAVRWQSRHFFVDEYQDVNPAQFRLLNAWVGDRGDLCVVGDPNQAIYSWNGADPSYITSFNRWFRGAHTVRLDHNYRSSPQVLGTASAIVPGGGHLQAHQPDGPIPTVSAYADEREEAAGIARGLRRARTPGRSWNASAVLARTHGQLVIIEESLRASGIPCRVRGSAPFLDLPEIRGSLSDMRRMPGGTELKTLLPDLVEAARNPAVGERPAVESADPAAERSTNLGELARLAREHVATEPSATVGGFVEWLRAVFGGRSNSESSAETSGSTGVVELATLHAAKGLEWPVVFLAGLEQGLMPIGHAETPEARAEERRLLYVGITRAESELHVSWAERRTFGERTVSRTPSPYLDRINAAIAALRNGDPPADWRRHLVDGRERLGHHPLAGSRADPRLLAALKSWRTATAQAFCIPPHVVFHDTTLAALAEARPADRSELLSLPGVGPVKAERYGDAVLSVLASAG